MAKKLPTLWPLQPHTEAKHTILRKYLQSWMPIMTLGWNYSKRAVLLDGFAGPGEYSEGEDGSPIIILKEAISHVTNFSKVQPQLRFIFVEHDKDRFLNLKSKIYELFNGNIKEENVLLIPLAYDYIRIYLINNQFEQFMQPFLKQMNGKLAPSFAFIDPFGFKDTPYYLIEELSKNDKSEVFINFMYEDINRFLKLPSLQKQYNRLFGTDKWTNVIENLEHYSAKERRFFLHKIYQDQLHKAGYKHVISFEMKNEKNATEYFLYFATNHIKGLEKMKDAMWSVDNSGSYTFSDYEALNGQLKFIEFDEPDMNVLAESLHTQFYGKKIPCSIVKDYVVTDTVFRRSKHANAALKILENSGRLIVHNRKKHGFPDYVLLDFI